MSGGPTLSEIEDLIRSSNQGLRNKPVRILIDQTSIKSRLPLIGPEANLAPRPMTGISLGEVHDKQGAGSFLAERSDCNL
jgi:hypothetical protein